MSENFSRLRNFSSGNAKGTVQVPATTADGVNGINQTGTDVTKLAL